MVHEPRACVNISCYLEIDHPNYQSSCRDCIGALVEETWACNYASSVKVLNRVCSVDYDFLLFDEPFGDPKMQSYLLETYGSIALRVFIVGFFALIIFCCVKLKKIKKSAIKIIKPEKEHPKSKDLEKSVDTQANTQANTQATTSNNPLESQNSQLVIDARCLQMGSLPIGKGHFGSVYKGTLKFPDSDTVYLVAIKKLRFGASFIGKY